MAFVRRKPTDQELNYFNKFNLRCPYGDKSRYKEIVFDKDSNFYLFYIHGPGYEKEQLPLYFGVIWNDTPYVIGLYESGYRKNEGEVSEWKLCENDSTATNYDQEFLNLLKKAITATNDCFSNSNIIENVFINF